MRRQGAKIGLRDREDLRRPNERTIPAKIPAETAYLESAYGFCGFVGLDGGRDRDRTCDPLDVNEVLSR